MIPESLTSVIEQVAHAEVGVLGQGLMTRLGIRPVAPQALDWPQAHALGIDTFLLPLHELHPAVSGNKWYKLKYHLAAALGEPQRPVLSFGGPWSNHLHALAWAGHALGLQTHGVVAAAPALSTPTLDDLRRFGMRVHFVGREQMREWRREGFSDDACPGARVIPEGGFDDSGVLGCASLGLELDGFDEIHLAAGTGCTLAGLRLGLSETVRLTGWNVHRGDWLAADVAATLERLGPVPGHWEVREAPGGRGFGPATYSGSPPVRLACEAELAIDPVYLPRLLAGVQARLHSMVRLPARQRWLLIHGGGLQGARQLAGCKLLLYPLPNMPTDAIV